jgi:hypothetical protein
VHGKDHLHPPLTKSVNFALADYIVKARPCDLYNTLGSTKPPPSPGLHPNPGQARLFNFFLNQGCVPLTDDHTLTRKIALENPWPRPLTVMGYDDTIALAGDLFEAPFSPPPSPSPSACLEAETDCVSDLGQVASVGVGDLSYYSRGPPLSSPIALPPRPATKDAPYNKSKTYVSFLIGDGDNVGMLKDSRRAWMKQRLASCKRSARRSAGPPCYPLMWTMSPATIYLAPEILQWYGQAMRDTGADWMILPPSGPPTQGPTVTLTLTASIYRPYVFLPWRNACCGSSLLCCMDGARRPPSEHIWYGALGMDHDMGRSDKKILPEVRQNRHRERLFRRECPIFCPDDLHMAVAALQDPSNSQPTLLLTPILMTESSHKGVCSSLRTNGGGIKPRRFTASIITTSSSPRPSPRKSTATRAAR